MLANYPTSVTELLAEAGENLSAVRACVQAVDQHITLCLAPTGAGNPRRLPPTRIRVLNHDALSLERSILRFLAIPSLTLSLTTQQSAELARADWASELAMYLRRDPCPTGA